MLVKNEGYSGIVFTKKVLIDPKIYTHIFLRIYLISLMVVH